MLHCTCFLGETQPVYHECQQYKICFQKPFTLISLLIKTALKFTQEQCTQNVDSVLQFDATDILNIT